MNATILTLTPPALLKAPAWDESMGTAPYVYSTMPAGNRCLWTCTWTVSAEPDTRYPNRQSTQIGILQWGPQLDVCNMSPEAIKAELEDIAARPGFYNWMAMQLLLNTDNDPEHYLYQVDDVITKARESYPSYTAAWNEPAQLHSRVSRPGWDVFKSGEPGHVAGLRFVDSKKRR